MRIRFADAGHLKGNIELDETFDDLPENVRQTTLQIAETEFAKQVMEDVDVEGRIRAYANDHQIALDDNVIDTLSALFKMHSSLVN